MKQTAILLAGAASLIAFGAIPVRAETPAETYQQQQADYQARLKDYWAARDRYDHDVARYDWRTYHHYPRDWPASYSRYREEALYDVPARSLVDRRIDARDGTRIGTVYDIDVDATGRLRGVQVDMPGNRFVWIDGADIRYDPDSRTLYTFLTTSQVRDMSVVG
jgi:hypothetical protein